MWIVSCSQVGHRACCRLKVAASCFLISFLKTDPVDFQALRCPDVILWQKSTGISSSLSVTSIIGSITACLCLQYRAWWFWRRRKTQEGSLKEKEAWHQPDGEEQWAYMQPALSRFESQGQAACSKFWIYTQIQPSRVSTPAFLRHGVNSVLSLLISWVGIMIPTLTTKEPLLFYLTLTSGCGLFFYFYF